MHIQIVTFQLDGISEADYRQQCEALAPVFAQLPGLIAKIWLADPATNTFGGVYTWQNRGAMEHYLASDLYAGLVTHPHLTGVTTRGLGVVDAPTRITRGVVAAARQPAYRPQEHARTGIESRWPMAGFPGRP